MKERPIIFSAEMVRAILDGRKTQTRRVVKPQPFNKSNQSETAYPSWAWKERYSVGGMWLCHLKSLLKNSCPYGQPGETRLWVRETWSTSGLRKYDYTGNPDHHGGPNDRCCAYAADATYKCGKPIPPEALAIGAHKWKSPIHMPRWASRLTLRLTDVRVERVQEISCDGARAEGIQIPVTEEGRPLLQYSGKHPPCDYYKKNDPPERFVTAHFASAWDALNAKRGFGWDVNPWVWRLTFEREP